MVEEREKVFSLTQSTISEQERNRGWLDWQDLLTLHILVTTEILDVSLKETFFLPAGAKIFPVDCPPEGGKKKLYLLWL